MKRKRYTEPQILKVLKESEAGRKTTDIIREYGISEKTPGNASTAGSKPVTSRDSRPSKQRTAA